MNSLLSSDGASVSMISSKLLFIYLPRVGETELPSLKKVKTEDVEATTVLGGQIDDDPVPEEDINWVSTYISPLLFCISVHEIHHTFLLVVDSFSGSAVLQSPCPHDKKTFQYVGAAL